jgi:hypothetical protein
MLVERRMDIGGPRKPRIKAHLIQPTAPNGRREKSGDRTMDISSSPAVRVFYEARVWESRAEMTHIMGRRWGVGAVRET